MKALLAAALLAALLFGAYSATGLYSIQPIGAIPHGVTLLVWRREDDPFFNSPDALCLKAQQGVSLLCRMMAISKGPKDDIIIRLPFIEAAYLASTDGRSFQK